jgi:hypothetical protein
MRIGEAMARDKAIVRRVAGAWVCMRPMYGFGDVVDARLFRTWRAAMDYAVQPAGTAACADLQLSGQTHDAIGSVPMWTPITR